MGSNSEQIHDLLIVGAGPAGCAAALRARALNLSAVILEREKFPRSRHCGGWLGPAGVALCGELGITAKGIKAIPFSGLRLYSMDLKKSAKIADSGLDGWLVDRAILDAALLEKAKAAGVILVSPASASAITLGEKDVTVHLETGEPQKAKLLVAADGTHSSAARLAHLAAAGRQPDLARCIFADGPGVKGQSGLDVAIGAGRVLQIATLTHTPDATRITFLTRLPQDAALKAYQVFASAATAAGLLPEKLGKPCEMAVPLGTALDMEAHVGKRSMLIGDAGGFVAAFSGEGIFPAMRSGAIAADVAARALQSRWVQDELATFGGEWRTALADYLRMPNTDLALLMPLVFNNEQMSARVARAFLLGQQF